MREYKIAFFDSGMGGISVLKRALEMYPYEHYIYYADTKNAPYGNLQKEEIYKRTYSCVQTLIKKDIKALVLACNTATNVGIASLREKLNIEIIGVEPAIKPAAQITDGEILVLTTEATVKQDKFKALCNRYDKGNIILSPLKYLAKDIEDNFFDKGFLYKKIDLYLKKYKKEDIKGLVLGCTHYVLINDIIREYFPKAQVFDGNTGTVINLFKKLRDKNLIGCKKEKNVEIFTSCADNSKILQYLKILKSF